MSSIVRRLRAPGPAAVVAAAALALGVPPATGQDAAAPSVLAPPRPDLRPVPPPRLADLEPVVADQIRAAWQETARTAAEAGVSGDRLAAAYGSLGRVLHAYEFFEPAEAAYLDARQLAPRDATWPHLLGHLYQQTGRLDEAAAQLVAARRLRPDDHAATIRLGAIYLGLNRGREAREAFEQVAAVFPAAAQAGLAEVALREGRFAEAVRDFHAALDRVPQATALHYGLAMAYRGLGRLDEARAHLALRGPGAIRPVDPIVEDVERLVRGERALVMRGRRAYDAGQYRDAADAFRAAVAAAPRSVPARVNLGLALAQMGDADAASAQFTAVLDDDPDNATAHAGLGMVRVAQGRDADAIGHLQAAVGQAPDGGGVGAALVGALLRLGRDDEAIALLSRARDAGTDDEGTLVSLAILLAGRERYREALDVLEEAHRRFPDRRPTATTLARLLASAPVAALRDGARALDLASRVYAAESTPAHAESVALALAELGRCDEAAQWIARAIAEAEQRTDAADAARLRQEAPNYAGAGCRPGR